LASRAWKGDVAEVPIRKSTAEEDNTSPLEPIYLRLSLTDRCNLRCQYCRPSSGPESPPQAAALSDEELCSLVARMDRAHPIGKIRLTGGEPLLCPHLPQLVARLRRQFPHTLLCMTTNAIGLPTQAVALRNAGLQAINISLDTADRDGFARLTRGGDLDRVLAGLQAAREAGFERLKINAVLMRSVNGGRLAELVALADELGYEIRVGFITTMSQPFCDGCNRYRMDCRGRFFACLRDEKGVDLATLTRGGRPDELGEVVRSQIRSKSLPESPWPSRSMAMIGG
jgi:cyclic pyranopterin phosphate synthase